MALTTEEIRALAEPDLTTTQTTGDTSPADIAPIEEVSYGDGE